MELATSRATALYFFEGAAGAAVAAAGGALLAFARQWKADAYGPKSRPAQPPSRFVVIRRIGAAHDQLTATRLQARIGRALLTISAFFAACAVIGLVMWSAS